jgi:hypothetical protein
VDSYVTYYKSEANDGTPADRVGRDGSQNENLLDGNPDGCQPRNYGGLSRKDRGQARGLSGTNVSRKKD